MSKINISDLNQGHVIYNLRIIDLNFLLVKINVQNFKKIV